MFSVIKTLALAVPISLVGIASAWAADYVAAKPAATYTCQSTGKIVALSTAEAHKMCTGLVSSGIERLYCGCSGPGQPGERVAQVDPPEKEKKKDRKGKKGKKGGKHDKDKHWGKDKG